MTVALRSRRGWISHGWAVFLLGGVLLMSVGCSYNDHRVMGGTEKWVDSDVHSIPKIYCFPYIAAVDSVASPFSMLMDRIENDWDETSPYHEDYKYYSFASSREIARSSMGVGYKFVATLLSIQVDAAYFVFIAGPIDIVTILSDGDAWNWVD